MSSIDDLSLISGISNISRISKTNSSALYKFDSVSNLSECLSMCRDINFTNQKVDSKKGSEVTKVCKALNTYEDSTCDYSKLRLIYECLQDIVLSNNTAIETDTMKKLSNLITIHKIKKYLYLPNNSKNLKEELTLLGIIDLPKNEFSYEEQLTIKSCLETKLREKIHSFITIYNNAGGSTKDLIKNNESMVRSRFQQKSELDNLHWKDKIDEVCIEYQRDSMHCLELLKQWNDLKNRMNEKNTRDAENLLLQAEIAEMKTIITKLSCIIRMYKETPITVDAFKILNKYLDEKIASVNEEIAEKTKLIKAYEGLKNTEYDGILKKYLELCLVVEKKRNFWDKL